MKHEMKMPDLATTGSAIRILKWLKPAGERVRRGDMILSVETDKAAMDVEATVDGVLLEIRCSAGAEVNVGDVIAVLETAGPAPAATPAAPARPAPSAAAAPSPAATAPTAEKPRGMFARNRAAADSPAPAPAAPKASGTITLSPARRTAARRLQESKQSIPHFYLQSSANATALIARRQAAQPSRLLWDAFFVQAVAAALRQYDRMACRYDDGALVPQGTDAIGVAADIDGELFVIPVSAPADKSAAQISAEIETAVAGLRSGDPEARRLRPGVMTITNLGGSGVDSFAAIINPPESAILAIGRIQPVVVPRGGGFAAEQRVNLTLAVDHRVVNGKYAAEFLAAIVRQIESP